MIDQSNPRLQMPARSAPGGARRSWRRLVVGLAVLSLLVTLPHSLEDFVYGIPERFDLDVLTAGILLAAGYAVHIIGILLAARGSPWGYGINLLVGLDWLVGAVADHLSEVLYAAP